MKASRLKPFSRSGHRSARAWYPADIVKTVVEADNANWFFTNVYGPLAASQAAGAAPIIKAWLAGEELPATFP